MSEINLQNRAAGHTDPPWRKLLTCAPAECSRFHIHLAGIGGAGLSAIATLLLEMGYRVSGSDLRLNDATATLNEKGAIVYRGHRASHIKDADVVLISSAVPTDNPEVVAARAAGIPVVKRASFLGPLLDGHHGIGVAGSHGKTTTASMIAIILLRAGMDPSFILGGQVAVGPAEGMQTSTVSARSGTGPFVIEADEYDGMFLGLPLEIAIVTNVEWDHVDCYPTPKAFSDAFRQFVGRLPQDGYLLLCADDPGALALRDAAPPGVTIRTYGLAGDADWRARNLRMNKLGCLDADIWLEGNQVANLQLSTPGRHNVRDALAALAAAHWHGISPEWAAIMLNDFHGAGRRFEVIGEAEGVTIIDDYAHHPTEVAATLSAARLRFPTRRIWAVFQPHTYSRTKGLLNNFVHSFDDADRVILLDIYAAREKIDLGMHSRILLEFLEHPDAMHIGELEGAAEHLLEEVKPEDVVIIMSAGDANQVGHMLLTALRQREAMA